MALLDHYAAADGFCEVFDGDEARAHYTALVERLSTMDGYADMRDVLPPDTLHANPETMAALVDGVHDRFGGWVGYLDAAGVSEETLDRLRARLLEPAG